MTAVDLSKAYREHYTARQDPETVDVPVRSYLMIDGKGDPGTDQSYVDAVSALYPIAYGIRAALKKSTGDADKVMPLEGLWWAENMSRFRDLHRSEWLWTMMILQPDVVTPELADETITRTTNAKKLVSGHLVRFESMGDGLAAQVLHRGPYAEEAPTINRLHLYIAEQGFQLRGKHREIYLTDPLKSAPANMRTVIRQPMEL